MLGEISVVNLNAPREALTSNLEMATHTEIKVPIDFPVQSFKDGVRCATDLYHENTTQNLGLREFLSRHFLQQSPL